MQQYDKKFLNNAAAYRKPTALFGVLLALFIYILWGIRFTQNDDVYFAMYGITHGPIHYGTLAAQHQGRLQFLFMIPVVSWLDTYTHSVLYDILQFGSVAFGIICFGIVVACFFGPAAGLFAALFYVGTTVLAWNHTLYTAGPIWFFLTFGVGCLALVALAAWKCSGNKVGYLAASYFLMVWAFTGQEFMLPLVGGTWLLAYAHLNRQDNSLIRAALGALKQRQLWLGVALMIAYGAAYVIFRHLAISNYDGVQIASEGGFSIRKFLAVMAYFSFNTSSLPFALSGFGFNAYDAITGNAVLIRVWPVPGGLHRIFEPSYSLPGLVGALAFWLVLRLITPKFDARRLLLMLLASAALLFLPNFLLAITERYQAWVAVHGVQSYAYTVFSHFGVCLLVLAGVETVLAITPARLQNAAKLAFTLIMFVYVTASSYQNQIVGRHMLQNVDRWRALDLAATAPSLRAALADKVVMAPRFWSLMWSTPSPEDYWTNWFRIKYGIKATVLRAIPSTGPQPNTWFDYASLSECGTLVSLVADRLPPTPPGQTGEEVTNVRLIERSGSPRAVVSWRDIDGRVRVSYVRNLPRAPGGDDVYVLPGNKFDPGQIVFNCKVASTGYMALSRLPLGRKISLTDEPPSFTTLVRGWSGTEITHRWTNAKTAELSVMLQPNDAPAVRFQFGAGAAVLDPANPAQRVIIKANGEQLLETSVVSGAKEPELVVDVPRRLWQNDSGITLVFELPDARSPLEAGRGTDPRQLALAFRWMQVDPVRP